MSQRPPHQHHNEIQSDEAVDLVKMCAEVYQDHPHYDGWNALSTKDLGLPDSYTDGIHFINKNAAAFVKESFVDGERTLAVVFRGTDKTSIADWSDDILDINKHYDLLKPLADAIDTFIKRHDIDRVLVTGHSLGGAMAEMFMKMHPDNPDTNFLGCTFGSPGCELDPFYHDDRIVEFRHSKDIVPKAGTSKWVLGYSTPGHIIKVDDSQIHHGLMAPFNAHGIRDYVMTIEHLHRGGDLGHILETHTDLSIPSQHTEPPPVEPTTRMLS